MGVQLNIKDADVVAATRALARELGKTVTETVREAIEEKRQRADAQRAQLKNEIMDLLHSSAELWHPRTRDMSTRQLVNELYDERGLPK